MREKKRESDRGSERAEERYACYVRDLATCAMAVGSVENESRWRGWMRPADGQ